MGFQFSRRLAEGLFRIISTTFLLVSVLTVQLAMLTEPASAQMGVVTEATSVTSTSSTSVSGAGVSFTVTTNGTGTSNCSTCHAGLVQPQNPHITVTFTDGLGGPTLSSGLLSYIGDGGGGVANPISSFTSSVISNLSVGVHTIVANLVYTPDPGLAGAGGSLAFSPSLTPSMQQTVNKANTTIPSVQASPSAPVANQPVTFTAAVNVNPPGSGTPTGTVTFTVDGTPHTVNVSGGTASFPTTLAGGGHTVTAVYNGDGNFNASNTAQLNITPGAAGTTTTVSSSANPSTAGQSVTFTATISGAGATGTVTFTVDGTPHTANVSGNTASFTTTALSVGSHTIIAAYSGDLNFAASTSQTLTQNVGIGPTTTTLASSANPSSLGQPVTFTAVVTVTGGVGTPTGTVNFTDAGLLIGTAALVGNSATLTTSSLALGSHPITATYLGSGTFATSASQALLQAVNTPADSLKLRALQLAGTKLEAQGSGQAISGAIDTAISEGFSGGNLITPSGEGLHFNFAAEPHENALAPAGAPAGAQDRVGAPFDALAYGPNVTKAPPAPPRKDWLFWMDVRGTGWDNRQTGADVQGTQVNSLVGLTRKISPDALAGVFGGFESFNYTSEVLTGHLKGDGWTVGGYFGWRLLPGLRFDAGVAESKLNYDGTAGMASGSFLGTRWLAQTGLSGAYRLSDAIELEPSARVYMLWEQENQYVDTLGTVQAERNFATGRASVGGKVSYTVAWSDAIKIVPYIGAYSDYYFSHDDAVQTLIPFANLQGWSARFTSGLLVAPKDGARVSLGGELGGIGSGNFNMWSVRGRLALPF
jgi:Bacterial Ig-like domain (group 3)/Autotransporter beta-domain